MHQVRAKGLEVRKSGAVDKDGGFPLGLAVFTWTASHQIPPTTQGCSAEGLSVDCSSKVANSAWIVYRL